MPHLPGNKSSQMKPNKTLDESENDELTLHQIMYQWFKYEPKIDSKAETKKTNDEKQRIRKILDNAINTSQLEIRLITKQLPPRDVYPSSITGTHQNHLDEARYRGLPFTRYETRTERYINAHHLANYLRAINEWPPLDSPLVTQRLSKVEQHDAEKQTSEAVKHKDGLSETEIANPSIHTQENPKPPKTLSQPNLKRLELLKEFIKFLEPIATKSDPDFDKDDMDCLLDDLVKAIQEWEVKAIKDKQKRYWKKLTKMDADLWNSEERKAICGVKQGGDQKSKKYFFSNLDLHNYYK